MLMLGLLGIEDVASKHYELIGSFMEMHGIVKCSRRSNRLVNTVRVLKGAYIDNLACHPVSQFHAYGTGHWCLYLNNFREHDALLG